MEIQELKQSDGKPARKPYYQIPIEIQYSKKVKHHPGTFELPDGPILGLILGRSGCGKSTVLTHLVPQIGQLSAVIICSLIPGVDAHQAIAEWCAKNEIMYAFATTPDESMSATEELTEAKGEGWGLIIMDDYCPARKSHTNPYTAFAVQCYQMLRNKRWHSITLTQSYINSDTICRANANLRVLFGVNDSYAIQAIERDIEAVGADINAFTRAFSQARDEAHAFVVVAGTKIYLANEANGYKPSEFKTDPYDDLRRLVAAYRTASSPMQKNRIRAMIFDICGSLGIDL